MREKNDITNPAATQKQNPRRLTPALSNETIETVK
jgi:hypothetical protein